MKEDLMPFKIGDLVVHPAFGLGHISELEEKQFYHEGAHLYYKITQRKQSMWILVEAQAPSGLRLVTPRSELAHYREVLQSSPVALDPNPQQRQLELVNRLQQGSFQGVCEVMRDLAAWGWQNPLSQADTTTLQKTRDSLSEEWAMAADISTTEASREIDSLLLTTRSTAGGLL
jgi:RNA polymerase-interacting CarD/CdnL/TRCF family regulator